MIIGLAVLQLSSSDIHLVTNHGPEHIAQPANPDDVQTGD
jgi:hypothetical protein